MKGTRSSRSCTETLPPRRAVWELWHEEAHVMLGLSQFPRGAAPWPEEHYSQGNAQKSQKSLTKVSARSWWDA